jgi:hypothetical protein
LLHGEHIIPITGVGTVKPAMNYSMLVFAGISCTRLIGFTPLITSPTRVTSKTKTLIDNIFFNEFCSNIVSGNLSGISDHMPQFALIPTKTSNIDNPRIPEKNMVGNVKI